jgi:hypothetical protein
MAWDEITVNKVQMWSGDKPMDQFSVCLDKIAAVYVDTFDRKPNLAEILYAFDIVLRANPTEYINDPDSVTKVSFRALEEN